MGNLKNPLVLLGTKNCVLKTFFILSTSTKYTNLLFIPHGMILIHVQ